MMHIVYHGPGVIGTHRPYVGRGSHPAHAPRRAKVPPPPHDVILSRINGLGEVGRLYRKDKREVCDLYNTVLGLTVMQKAYRCGIKETGGMGVGGGVEIPPITPCTLIYDKCLQI